MLDIKLIRKEPEIFSKKLKSRNANININDILSLDKKNREIIQEKEKLEQEKKIISKKQDKKLYAKSKEISKKIEEKNFMQTKIKKKLDENLSSLPNIALDDVPVGKGEEENKEIRKNGVIPKFNFKPLSHYEIGKKLNLLDFDLATKTSGARFVFLKDSLALLERAISNFMLDTHTKKFGYKEISPPLIVNESAMFGTGQLPKFEKDQFVCFFGWLCHDLRSVDGVVGEQPPWIKPIIRKIESL